MNSLPQVLIDGKTPHAVALMLTSSRFMLAPSWIEQAKAVKNDTEIQGFRNAYARDGAAMVRTQISSSAPLLEADGLCCFITVLL